MSVDWQTVCSSTKGLHTANARHRVRFIQHARHFPAYTALHVPYLSRLTQLDATQLDKFSLI